jgi:hypothetical protein
MNKYANIPYPRAGIMAVLHRMPYCPQNHRGIWTNSRRPVIILWLYFNSEGNDVMAASACNQCGMVVNTSCAKWDVALVDDSLELDNGTKVKIAKCPSYASKIKLPSCCGEEMACSI